MLSSKFLMYRFLPWYLSTASFKLCSNRFLSSASLSAFFWAFPTYHSFPSNICPFRASTALAASSEFSKFTKPKHFDFPSGSRITTALVIFPYSPKILVKSSSVVDSARFFT
uniref:Uncharacterized protein n=1 Tax=Opuntia streptacantha TaxID=393608 RepID=A0A7C9D875_OPUST